MNFLKTSWSAFRHICRHNVHFKSTDTSNFQLNSKDKLVIGKYGLPNGDNQNQYKNNHREEKINNNNKPRKPNDSVLSDIIFSNKNNPDSFGSLSDDWKIHQHIKEMPDEKDDVIEKQFSFDGEGKRKLTVNQYGRLIKKFVNENKVALAIDVLETRILKNDKVKPENYIYNLLIGACGRVGYTRKAFSLYNDMKKRGLKITGHTYTSLFNACANSPYPEDSLKRARNLQVIMLEKGVLKNSVIYHAMIKAFGRCGDLETAFMLVDEMWEEKISVSADTFNFLLQACITDKTSGFRHALLVWRKMLDKRIHPDLFSFNLLLRCSRDCGLGDEVATQQVIQLLLVSGQVKSKRLEITEDTSTLKAQQVLPVPSAAGVAADNCLPNLISLRPTMGSVTAVKNINLPEHRLMLMGGAKEILAQMKFVRVNPDIKTFTQLLDQLSPSIEDEQRIVLSKMVIDFGKPRLPSSEHEGLARNGLRMAGVAYRNRSPYFILMLNGLVKELLEAAKEQGVTLDIDFYNMLIRKRCLRGDYENAKTVLKIIHGEKLRPTIMTFGVLAMSCQNTSTANQLLEDINNFGYRPNVEILGTLLKNACYARNSGFVLKIMNILEKEEIKPNEKFLKHLENFYHFATTALSNKSFDDTQRHEAFLKFCEYYQVWRQKAQPDDSPHPWEQFQSPYRDPKDVELMNYGKVQYSIKKRR